MNFSDIVITSALPYTAKYRAHQAWRGGYGEALDDAVMTLTDAGLTFIFSVRNMRLESEIGLHWTMKCGNDIIEGSALIPPIAMAPPSPADPAPIDVVHAEPIGASPTESLLPASPPIPAAASQDILATTVIPGAAGGSGFGAAPLFAPVLAALAVPGSGSDVIRPLAGNTPVVPVAAPTSTSFSQPDVSVPEPSASFLLLAGLFAILAGKRSVT